MTITINVPVFPLRKEIAERKRRLHLSLGFTSRGKDSGTGAARPNAAGPDARYTADGLEFDVSGFAKPQKGPGQR